MSTTVRRGPRLVALPLHLLPTAVLYGDVGAVDAQEEVVAVVTDELRRVHRDYGVAFAKVLTLAKQRGLDCFTVERWVHALTLEGQGLPNDADCMKAALQRAAQAFRDVVDVVRRVGVRALA